MKTWQIFAIGTVALIATMFLQAYEAIIAGVGALVVIAAVVFGFLARPREDVFYIRTTDYIEDVDGDFAVEHQCLAVRIELVRLWLLFIPTFAAVAFLLYTSAKGTTWNYSLLDLYLNNGATAYLIGRAVLLLVVGVLSAWMGERWVLRDADACSAGSVSIRDGRISYMFVDRTGEYYGGEGFAFRLCSPELSTIVLYNIAKPQLNKILMACLFHRLIVIGRGITDLDEATLRGRVQAVQSSV